MTGVCIAWRTLMTAGIPISRAVTAPCDRGPLHRMAAERTRTLPFPFWVVLAVVYGSRSAWRTVARIRHRVMGLMGDSTKPRER